MDNPNTNVPMKPCKHCKTMIPKGAKVCPNCRKKQSRIGKWIVIAIILIILLATLAGGGNGEKRDSINLSTEGNTEVTNKGFDDSKLKELSVENKTIFEEQGIKVSTDRISHEGDKTVLQFVAENTTKEDWSIVVHGYAVNDLICGSNELGFGTVDVPTEKKGNFAIEVEDDWLEQYGFDDISSFKATFWGYKDSYAELQTKSYTIKTNHFDKSVTVSPKGDEVYSDDDIKVWYVEGDNNDYKFLLYCNGDIGTYTLENCSVNEWGYNITDYTYDLYDEVAIKKTYAIFTLPIDSSFIENNKIEKIESLEFDVKYSYDYKKENSNKVKVEIK